MYRHKGFLSSQGINGWYKTVEKDEVIKFDYPVNSLIIETLDKPLTIKIDNLDDLWYIGADKQEGIEGLTIRQIQVLGDAGTEIKWKALLV